MKTQLLQKTLSTTLGATLLIAIWQATHLYMQSSVLPSPATVFTALPNLLNQNILAHISASLYRVSVALTFSLFFGLILGIISAGQGVVAKVISSFLFFTYPIPRVALLPVVMLTFGLGDTSKVIMISLIVVYPIIIVVRDSVRAIPKEMYNALTCYGASYPQRFIYVTLPWATSAIISTLRISLGTAIAILFFTETYGTRFGMGFFIMDSWMSLRYVQMYAGIVVLSLVGFVLFSIVDIIEKIFLHWRM